MEKYLVVIEKVQNNYPAFSPDVWGCAATGNTVEDTLFQIREALLIHIESMVSDGEDIPKPKGISQHLSEGVFRRGEISDEYFITEAEIPIPLHA
jgi:predicted RNase H-like HicB family nuclease